jgi:hypothetical protein
MVDLRERREEAGAPELADHDPEKSAKPTSTAQIPPSRDSFGLPITIGRAC